MNLSKYIYRANDSFLDYEFISEGPKGRIKKVVRFTPVAGTFFNLGFGDLEEETGDINDTVITDNKDSRKILATVASTLYDFYVQYPEAKVFVQGSSPARTRLYRIGITNNWQEISTDFDIYGLRDDEWELFSFGIEYEAFLIEFKYA